MYEHGDFKLPGQYPFFITQEYLSHGSQTMGQLLHFTMHLLKSNRPETTQSYTIYKSYITHFIHCVLYTS